MQEQVLKQTLEGIDVSAGLSYVSGNVTIYKKFLVKFYSNHKNFLPKLQTALAEQDYEKARQLAHSMKGVAGYMGATELFRHARNLEGQLKNKNYHETDMLYRKFADSFQKVLNVVAKIHDTEQKDTEITELSREVLVQLKELLAQYDVDGIALFEQLLPLLLKKGYQQETHIIKNSLKNYDFDGALESLDQIIAKEN